MSIRLKTSIPRTLFFAFALFLSVCLNPQLTTAQENAGNAGENVTASHLFDGKEFIGPTGEKGKKVHHEDVLRFNDGKFTSSECFQYGFKGGGIGLIAAMSRLYPFPKYLLLASLAITPLPLLFLAGG